MRPALTHTRLRAAASVLTAAAACSLMATPAAAGTHRLRLQPLRAASATPTLFRTRVPDSFRARPVRPHGAARARAAAAQAVFRTADGTNIPVAVSSSYTPNPVVEQGYVNMLGGLVHGSELAKLSVYIATPHEIEKTFCGDGALACYIGDEERMYVPGVDQNSDPPVQFLIEHEYGHHIELNRSNAPWSAFDVGTKAWATYENVCALKRRGKIGTNYYNDPSEAFAESYADMQFPGVDFIYTDLLAPDQGAFRAIRQDVLHPWTGPRTVTLHGSFDAGGKNTRAFTLRTPLDGSASVDIAAPAGADYRVAVMAGSRMVRRARSHTGHAGHAAVASSYTVCGARTLTVKVTRAAGSGPFTISATLP